MEKMNFLENLEHLLEIHNMKKSELAKTIGITQPTITAWYSKGCDNVSLSILRKICSLFHITLDELIYGNLDDRIFISFNVNDYSTEELQVIKTVTQFIQARKE
jgi:DNA-binding XRE family transcriptional regulator